LLPCITKIIVFFLLLCKLINEWTCVYTITFIRQWFISEWIFATLMSTPGFGLVLSGCPAWVCPGVGAVSCELCLCLVSCWSLFSFVLRYEMNKVIYSSCRVNFAVTNRISRKWNFLFFYKKCFIYVLKSYFAVQRTCSCLKWLFKKNSCIYNQWH
jgi:hypothetical protein